MKVLHVIDSLGLGGAQTVVKGIFEAQQANNDIFLYALRHSDTTTNIKHKNILIHNSSSKYSLKPLLKLKKIIDKEKVDILHCHLFRSNIFGFLLKVIWFPSIKLIIHEHGGIVLEEKGYSTFLRVADTKIDKFIAISKYISELLIEQSSIEAEKISIIYNFVDLEKFTSKNIEFDIKEKREKQGFSENDFVIGFAGRIIEIKGWKEFVNSAKLINQKYPQTRFLIAGTGEDSEILIREIRGYNFIKYIGYVSDMPNFYKLLDCFVMPSHVESMGLTQLEAQAMQVPVLASNIEGLREVVNDGVDCLLFAKGNAEELAEKIQMIVDSPELRKQLIEAGRENVKKYDLREYVRKLDFVYESF